MTQPPVWLYSLSTCSMCRELKKTLNKKKIRFETIELDRLAKEDQKEIIDRLKSNGENISFPTLIVGDQIIGGYNKQKIAAILKSVEKSNKKSLWRLFMKP